MAATTDAILVMDPSAGAGSTVPVTMIEIVPPATSEAVVQLTVPAVTLQTLSTLVALGDKIDAGSASVTSTCWASDGPAFDTTILQLAWRPATSGPAVSTTFEIERSAALATSLVAVEVFDPGNGSGVGDETVAVLLKPASASALMMPGTEMLATPAGGRSPSPHLSVLAPSTAHE